MMSTTTVSPTRRQNFNRLVTCIKSQRWSQFSQVLETVLPEDLLLTPEVIPGMREVNSDTNQQSRQNVNIMHIACINHIPLSELDLLIEHCFNVTVKDETSDTGNIFVLSSLLNGQDGDGSTPLHDALLFVAPEDVLLRLISECEVHSDTTKITAVSMKNKSGLTPLHVACRDSVISYRVVEAMLEVDSCSALRCIGTEEREDGKNTMQVLWERICRDRVWIDSVLTPINEWEEPKSKHVPSSLDNDKTQHDVQILLSKARHVRCLKMLWEIMCCLVLSTASGSGSSPLLVHSAVQLVLQGKIPLEVVMVAVTLHPEQLLQADDEGHLPLHVALSSSAVVSDQVLRKKLLDFLLTKEPKAAGFQNESNKGLSSLHMAIEAGIQWQLGMESIIKADPLVLVVKDRCTGLVPFQFSAFSEHSTLETTFHLLLACPTQVMTSE